MKLAFVLILLISLALLLGGCAQQQPQGDVPSETERDYLLGIGPIPRNFPGSSQSDWQDMFTKVKDAGELLLAQNEWRDSPEKSGEIPEILKLVGDQKNSYNYRPVFGINFYKMGSPENPIIDWANQDEKEKYKAAALKICKNYNAEYLGLGIEVNHYYYYNPEDFDNFVSLYKEIYDAVKAECDSTKVFVTFQLEMMKGIGEKTWGKKIGPQWEILNKFSNKLDLIAFTSYPEVEYSSPEKIPEDYYSGIIKNLPENYRNKKIAFTEIAWTDDDGSFVSRFSSLAKEMNLEFAIWAFMHDINTPGPLTKIGLRKSNGEAKGAWDAWIKLKNSK